MDAERDFAEASPMPDPADAATDVYMEDGPIALKYGPVVVHTNETGEAEGIQRAGPLQIAPCAL